MNADVCIYFYDEEGKLRGSEVDSQIPLNLYKGMKISIHAEGTFEVIDWNYHHGHPDEKAGLRITLKQTSERFEVPRK